MPGVMESLATAHPCLSLSAPFSGCVSTQPGVLPAEGSVFCIPNLYPGESKSPESQLWGSCALLVIPHLCIMPAGMGLVLVSHIRWSVPLALQLIH